MVEKPARAGVTAAAAAAVDGKAGVVAAVATPTPEPRDRKMAGGKTASPTSSGSSGSGSESGSSVNGKQPTLSTATEAEAEAETQPLLPSEKMKEEGEEEEEEPRTPTSRAVAGGKKEAAAAAGSESAEAEAEAEAQGGSGSDSKKQKKKLSASDRHALRRLWRETVPHEKAHLGVGVVAMLVSSATNMAFPALVGRVLDLTTRAAEKESGAGADSKERGDNRSSLKAFVARALLIFVAGALASGARTYCLRVAKEGTARRLRKKLLRSLLKQEKAFFDDPAGGAHRTGEMVAVLEGDVESASEVFTTRLADGLRSASSAINGTAMLLRLSPKLTAVALGIVPVFTTAIAANVVLTRQLTARQRELQAAGGAFAQERLGNLTTVHAFTAEARDEAAYAALLDEAHGLAGRVALAKGVFMGGLFFAGSATMTAVLYFGGSLAGKGEISVGDLTSFSMYTGLVALGFSGLSSYASEAWKAAVAAGRVFRLVDRVPRLLPGDEAGEGEAGGEKIRPAGAAKGHIRFDDVHFAYPNRPAVPVLAGVSLEVQPGQVAAIVGPSGAGKSTLLALLLRLYAPLPGAGGTGGKVLVDGTDVARLDTPWLRQQIGLVEQEPALFSGTIADNIRYGRPEATDAEVEAAARAANAHAFIAAFPEGYATQVGERGKAQLSGGERQRVTLARALIKRPPILLLDEATSALDHESERAVQEALERAMEGRTVVVVAHRLSTVEKADVIFVLDEGKVVESGDFKSLMARPDGHFVRLHQASSSSSLAAFANALGGL